MSTASQLFIYMFPVVHTSCMSDVCVTFTFFSLFRQASKQTKQRKTPLNIEMANQIVWRELNFFELCQLKMLFACQLRVDFTRETKKRTVRVTNNQPTRGFVACNTVCLFYFPSPHFKF